MLDNEREKIEILWIYSKCKSQKACLVSDTLIRNGETMFEFFFKKWFYFSLKLLSVSKIKKYNFNKDCFYPSIGLENDWMEIKVCVLMDLLCSKKNAFKFL